MTSFCRLRAVSLTLAFAVALGASGSAVAAPDAQARLKKTALAEPLRFEANRGQSDASVRFIARGPGYTVLVRNTDVLLNLRGGAIRMRLPGANPSPVVNGIEKQPGVSNYLIGRDPSRWRTGVPAFGRVQLKEVYPGIDLIYYGSQRKLEYDFVVRPGADPNRIRLAFDAAQRLSTDATGDLVIHGPAGEIRQHRPVIYQQDGATRTSVDGRYAIGRGGAVRFELARYDHSRELTIDPKLSYSTYFGGSKDEGIFDLAVDSAGNAYIAGITGSSDLPMKAPMDGTLRYSQNTGHMLSDAVAQILPSAFGDAFIAKLAPDGASLVWSTYLGGSSADGAEAIALGPNGNIAVVGATSSPDFPVTLNAYNRNLTLATGRFISVLTPKGDSLVYSTYFGTNRCCLLDSSAEGDGIAFDSTGKVIIAGQTLEPIIKVGGATGGNDLPIRGGVQSTFGGGLMDAFVARFDPAAQGDASLIFSTYLGGSGVDSASVVAADSSNNIYVRGGTCSADFPVTAGAYQKTLKGACNAFLTKLSADGSKILYSTYFGGSAAEYGPDGEASFGPLTSLAHSESELQIYSTVFGGSFWGSGLAVDKQGFAYITGSTRSTDFPTTAGAYQLANRGDLDAFVAKLDTTQSGAAGLIYSTLLGGTALDRGRAIAVDDSGVAYVYGETMSANFPVTADAIQLKNGGEFDSFLSVISADGKSLLYSTYLGGKSQEQGLHGIALGPNGDVFLAACSYSPDYPVTSGAFQPKNAGGWDGVVTRIEMGALNVTGPQISWIANAASGAKGAVSPDEYVAIYGQNLGPATGVVAGVPVKGLGNVKVTFSGVEGFMNYASGTQINVVAPFGISGTTDVVVEYGGLQSAAYTATVTAAAPGIFTTEYGPGPAVAINYQDGKFNSASHPVKAGQFIELWATGQGLVTPAVADGAPITAGSWPTPIAPVSVVIGGETVTPAWVGLLYTGEVQVNVKIPSDAKTGDAVPLQLQIGDVASRNDVTVSIASP